jgi:hypothetical protein
VPQKCDAPRQASVLLPHTTQGTKGLVINSLVLNAVTLPSFSIHKHLIGKKPLMFLSENNMDKYDILEESERDYESEDYFYEQQRRAGVETKEKQVRYCYNMLRMTEEREKWGNKPLHKSQ